MVYDWDGKETLCYKLYVEEKKSLPQVARYLRENFNFAPSKRAFQVQFQKWNFPVKRKPAHQNDALVARVQELWEQNVVQKDMLEMLQNEGFDIGARTLLRLRGRNKWYLRVPNGGKSYGQPGDAALGEVEEAEDEMTREDAELLNTQMQPQQDKMLSNSERIQYLQTHSDELLAAKKRRRRTRGWGCLPADPPDAPPRFPSETTLDESKAYLHMSNQDYRVMREQFQGMCEEAGFVKKTQAGPEKWQAAKDKLVAENAHLNRQFHGPLDGVPVESKSLALDVVCTDVTKRMRTMSRFVTVADAKNALGLNPEESRLVRNELYTILRNDNFVSMTITGETRWAELKKHWMTNSEVMQRVLNAEATESQRAARLKAVHVLARDVVKRVRDDMNKADPSGKRQINRGPGPGPAAPKVKAANRSAGDDNTKSEATPQPSQIDPNLLAAVDTAGPLEQLQHYAASATELALPELSSPPDARHTRALSTPSRRSLPIWVRAASTSHPSFLHNNNLWLSMLPLHSNTSRTGKPSLAELRAAAGRSKSGASVTRVWAVLDADAFANQPDSSIPPDSGESTMPVDSDEELAAYLDFQAGQDEKGKVGFVVELQLQS